MPINWDKFQASLDENIERAGEKTDQELANQVSGITRLTDEEIKKMFPDPADVKKLAELMQIVKQASDRNDKINNIVSNAEKYGGIILNLLSKFA